VHNDDSMLARFRRRFWLPPRRHGEAITDRTVSFLELFYDLVYVVVIGRLAHTLAGYTDARNVGEFVVIFGLIWIAWLNGTLYYELHGREDGRTRLYVFIQMLLLAVLAVFTGNAGGADGAAFAVVYVLYLVVLTWLWYTVWLLDTEEFRGLAGRYLVGMGVTIAGMTGSVFVPEGPRTVVWAVLVLFWIIGANVLNRDPTMRHATVPTDSLVERFGLFVIIVLGEVIVGVVTGLAQVPATFRVIATGLLGLMIAFAYWWTYFDYAGRRLPRPGPSLATWMTAHLPVTGAIAAAGAAMVSLVEHAGDSVTPEATAWLLAGSVAVGLVALIVIMGTLENAVTLPGLYRPVMATLGAAAVVELVVGWWAPAPWLLALALVATLSVVWWFAVDRWLRVEEG